MQPTHRLLLYILALTGLAVDQAGKYGVFAWLISALTSGAAAGYCLVKTTCMPFVGA